MVPALEAQLREAESEQQKAEEARARAEQRYDEATGRFQDADGKKRVAVQEHAAAVERFERVGVPDPTEQALEAATVEVERLEQELRTQDQRRDALLTTKGAQEGSLREAEGRLRTAEEKLTSERREAEPAVKRWEALQERATRERLLGGLLGDGPAELSDVRGHVNLVQDAYSDGT